LKDKPDEKRHQEGSSKVEDLDHCRADKKVKIEKTGKIVQAGHSPYLEVLIPVHFIPIPACTDAWVAS
jgi:hypothetical protein